MISAKVGHITFDGADGMNIQDMVATEHEIIVESEKETITVLNCWGYHQ